MPDKNVQLPDGRIVAFPDSMSDDDIGNALKSEIPKSNPNLVERLEKWYTTPQQGNPDPYMLNKVGYAPQLNESPQEAAGQTAKLGAAFMAPSMAAGLAAAPVSTIAGIGGSVAGGVAGGMAGKYVGEKVGAPELGGDIGGLVGAFTGAGAAKIPDAVKTHLFDVAGKPTPLARLLLGNERAAALSQVLTPPNVVPEANLPPGYPKGTTYETLAKDMEIRGRQQGTLDVKQIKAQTTAEKQAQLEAIHQAKLAAARSAIPSNPFGEATSSANVTMAQPGTPPAATSAADTQFNRLFGKEYAQARDLAQWETGSPEGRPTPFQPQQAQMVNKFEPQDLINRTKKVVIPGEEPTAADLKRAGDLTQAPLARLKSLARFGDRLAQNEINRRLRNQ